MPTAEHIKAKEWRERLQLSYDQLADLTGYSALTIRWMEKGVTPPRTARHIAGKQKSKPINWFVFKRYKMACSAAERQLASKREFNWGVEE